MGGNFPTTSTIICTSNIQLGENSALHQRVPHHHWAALDHHGHHLHCPRLPLLSTEWSSQACHRCCAGCCLPLLCAHRGQGKLFKKEYTSVYHWTLKVLVAVLSWRPSEDVAHTLNYRSLRCLMPCARQEGHVQVHALILGRWHNLSQWDTIVCVAGLPRHSKPAGKDLGRSVFGPKWRGCRPGKV